MALRARALSKDPAMHKAQSDIVKDESARRPSGSRASVKVHLAEQRNFSGSPSVDTGAFLSLSLFHPRKTTPWWTRRAIRNYMFLRYTCGSCASYSDDWDWYGSIFRKDFFMRTLFANIKWQRVMENDVHFATWCWTAVDWASPCDRDVALNMLPTCYHVVLLIVEWCLDYISINFGSIKSALIEMKALKRCNVRERSQETDFTFTFCIYDSHNCNLYVEIRNTSIWISINRPIN